MGHIVIYTGTDETAAYHRCDTVADAAAFVEHLRNVDGITDARIFRLDEVSFEVKPYYRVEIPGLETPGAPAMVTAPAEVAPVAGPTGDGTSDDVADAAAADEQPSVLVPAVVPPTVPTPPLSSQLPPPHLGGPAPATDPNGSAGGPRRGLFGR